MEMEWLWDTVINMFKFDLFTFGTSESGVVSAVEEKYRGALGLVVKLMDFDFFYELK